MATELEELRTWMLGGLTDDEWLEICALDYTFIWGFSDDEERDNKRYQELVEKRYNKK